MSAWNSATVVKWVVMSDPNGPRGRRQPVSAVAFDRAVYVHTHIRYRGRAPFTFINTVCSRNVVFCESAGHLIIEIPFVSTLTAEHTTLRGKLNVGDGGGDYTCRTECGVVNGFGDGGISSWVVPSPSPQFAQISKIARAGLVEARVVPEEMGGVSALLTSRGVLQAVRGGESACDYCP